MKQALTPEKFPRSLAVCLAGINGELRYTNTNFQWLRRMAEFEKTKREANASSITKIDGSAAAKIIADNAGVHSSEVGFDQDEAKLVGLKQGEQVEVIPDDNGKDNYPW